MIKLSIIVPVYNVEKYIRPCIESIYEQGLDEQEFEVIIINDGTKDKSMEMIDDLINLHKNITIINQENQGLSVARNNGIKAAKGEYILMPDSDDLLIKNSLKPLLEKALETKVDLIFADYIIMNDEKINLLNISHPQQKEHLIFSEKKGYQYLLEDLDPKQGYIWRILFRLDFLKKNHITFIPGIYVQDKPFLHEVCLKASRCIKTNYILNIYRKGHPQAASYKITMRYAKDYCTSIEKLWELSLNIQRPYEVKHKLEENAIICTKTFFCRVAHEVNDKKNRYIIVDHYNKIAFQIYPQKKISNIIYFFILRNMPHTFINARYLYAKVYEDKLYPFFKHLL